MSRIRSLCVSGLLVAAACGAASAQDVKYEKYKLDNGMTVILHEDHSLPVAAINIWYRVGSKDEPVHRSGFAHLFEHLMFMGTKRVPNGEFDTIMEGGGGSNNASTAEDRTNYFSNGPASLLPTLLWLDADRLEDLGRTMDQAKLDKQRDVVKNERRQSYENRPYGKAELQIQGMMYPVGHPYHIPVIGTHEDLNAAQVSDVRDFFATYYVPNNAALVVAGDFDPAKIKPMVAKLFGTIARGGAPMHATAGPVKLDGVKRATMMDKVQLPMIAMAYHSPGEFKDGDAEMDLVGALLSEGKTSRLYKRLVYEDKIAVDVSAYQDSKQYGSTFRVDVKAPPGADLDRVERVVDEELMRFVKEGPKADELERRKATIELAMLSRMQSIEAIADRMNEYEYYFGEPNSFKRDLDRYRNATVDGVRQWAEKVLTPDARLILRVLPEAPPREKTARDTRPAAMESGPFSPQAPQTFTLSNGIPVMLWQKSELPLVAMTVEFTPGNTIPDVSKAGCAELMAQMLDEGAGDLDSLAFGDAMQSLGANFGASADRETVDVSLTVLKRNLDRAAGLMADAIQRPRMEDKDWERVKRLHLEDLKQQDEEPGIVAGRVATRLLFGEKSPYGWPMAGTPATVGKLSLEDVKAIKSELLAAGQATVLVAGDLTEAEAKSVLEKALGGWKSESAKRSGESMGGAVPRNEISKMQFAIVNRPEAVQTVVLFIMPGPKYDSPNRVQYELLNTILGGSFTSRLNQNLREAHGYTYGAHSRFSMTPRSGYFTASSSVRADVTGKSLKEFLDEIGRIRKGDVTPEETSKARETLRTDTIQTFAGLRGVLSEASVLVASHLPFETIAKDMKSVQAVEAGDLNKLARSALPLDEGVLVLVGDKAAILKQIATLKLALPKPIEVTPRGEVVGEQHAAK